MLTTILCLALLLFGQPAEPYCRTVGPGTILHVDALCPTTTTTPGGTPVPLTDLKYMAAWYEYGPGFTERREAQVLEVTDPDGADENGDPLPVQFALAVDDWPEGVEHRVYVCAGDATEGTNWSGFVGPGKDVDGVPVTFKYDATAPGAPVILQISATPGRGVRIEVVD